MDKMDVDKSENAPGISNSTEESNNSAGDSTERSEVEGASDQETAKDGTTDQETNIHISDDCEVILQTFRYSDDKNVTNICDEIQTCKLIEDLNQARKQGIFCDITLLTGPDKYPIKGHRVFLSLDSEYFRVMFTTDLKEGSQSEVELPKIDVSTMESVMEFIYTGRMNVTNEDIENITRAANFFGMSKLLENCTSYIKKRISYNNCVEILEFAEQISNNDLKDFAKDFFILHFDEISSKSLDIMNMTTSVLFEVIGDDMTSIHGDPQENEERLFKIGWSNLQTKLENIYQTFLPKLLKAVHLPLVSEEFLSNLVRNVGDHQEAKAIIEEAKSIKTALVKNKAGIKDTQPNEGTLIWCKDRSYRSGKVSVTCGNLRSLKDSYFKFYSEPIVLKGKAWRLNVNKDYFRLAASVQCLSDLNAESVRCSFQFELVPTQETVLCYHCNTRKSSEQKPYFSETLSHRFASDSHRSDQARLMEVDEVLKNYYDKDQDCCTVITHITVGEV